MEHLDEIHYERFYRDLIDTAFLINEVVEGETESEIGRASCRERV